MPLALPAAPCAPPSFVTGLAAHGDRPALRSDRGDLSYAELADRVRDVADRLGPARRLVLVQAANTVEAVVAYLACLLSGNPVLLTQASAVAGLLETYDPDVVVLPDDDWALRERRAVSAHTLHPELALLLSTSGSTGSPKLVRLSAANLSANAASIADYLGLRDDDVAVTTLPLGYCYGLSVLHSHLTCGASVLLTELSVVDPCFWQQVDRHGATSLAGVPHTFDLLGRAGFADRELPSLRRVTQAGGRMAPELVRRYAELGQRRGWDLFVMYGQTEATARMAYLPPELAVDHPTSIGRAVPGGQLSLESVDSTGTGELVYTGPNVMLGYATSARDLALGRTVDRLRTGDLARRDSAGLFEVVGRTDRVAKLFGLRIDLDRVEQTVRGAGTEVACVVSQGELRVAACAPPAGACAVREQIAAAAGLPVSAVRVAVVAELPRLLSGKPDLRAVAALAAAPASPTAAPAADVDALCALLAEVLGRPVGPDDTFVGLGGDSLSYVEVSLRLEEALGTLPGDWHLTPLRDLVPAAPPVRRWGRVLETGVLVRALAILLIVGSHTDLWLLPGGAHVLLGVAGFNFARFALAGSHDPVRAVLRSIGRILVPSVAVIGVAAAVTERYTLANVLLLNGVVGPDRWGPTWHYWYLEVLVWTLLACAALLALAPVRRAERRWPWAFALGLLSLALASRHVPDWLPTGPDRIHTWHVVVWFFTLGWAAARADTRGRRWVLTAVLLASLPGFFEDGRREALVAAGLLSLLWVSTVRVPRAVVGPARLLAAASLHVYVTHWLVYPPIEERSRLLALIASLAVGLAYWEVDRRLQSLWHGRHARRPVSSADPGGAHPTTGRHTQPLACGVARGAPRQGAPVDPPC